MSPRAGTGTAGLVRLLRHAPSGLLLHVAGPTEEGFRIIEVWESEAAWRRFEPFLHEAVAALDEDVHPRVTVRDLHGEHEVLDRRWAHVATIGSTG